MSMFNVNLPSKLDTQSYYQPTPPVQPALPMTIVKPVSYQFQVVEYMKDSKVVKVELQVQQTTHDENGNVMLCSGFVPVPRIQMSSLE